MPKNKGEHSNSLNGLGEIETIIQEKLSARDREHELIKLKEELEEAKKQLQESEDYAESLEQQLEESKSSKYKLGKLDLVELGGAVLEKLAVKNSPALEKMGLGGLISPNNTPANSEGENMEVSFQKKTEDNNQNINPGHLQYIPVLQQLDTVFDRSQLEIVMQILAKFSEEPENLKTVAELLNIQIP